MVLIARCIAVSVKLATGMCRLKRQLIRSAACIAGNIFRPQLVSVAVGDRHQNRKAEIDDERSTTDESY